MCPFEMARFAGVFLGKKKSEMIVIVNDRPSFGLKRVSFHVGRLRRYRR
jgi:hypothetical protein